MSSSALVPVPFHGTQLFLVTHNDQPYTPMRPIVEGMGLAWQVQHRKLDSNKERWGVTIMVIPSKNGEQETLCMPLRKLAAWLMTISPNKVKPEIREKILRYQNECDDVLWEYWTKGRAENSRTVQADSSNPNLTLIQKRILSEIVTSRSHLLHFDQRDPMMAKMWQGLKDHFRIESIDDLPGHLFQAARSFLETFPVEIPETRPPGIPYEPLPRIKNRPTQRTVVPGGERLNLDFPKKTAIPEVPFWREIPPDWGDDSLSLQDLLSPEYPAPLKIALTRLEEAGYDVEGLWLEYWNLRHHLQASSRILTEIYNMARARRLP
ncbi:MAG: putative antirepressor protein (Ant) [Leptospirillum sp. Group II 'C75']|uniref:phage antirepressor N-terminal domain-containing protein n=1 Tax=Leptospirillum sp. Group II 'CF-1' TaxID=1660083 RepID=UPI00029CB738|nr:phage antirepressor N-terminal domain-containing protein [Leptospirillum sp. Group II 'CF-1']EIJ75193.1 MAG: putative antirepressor protein (Ant) [Leptospirillum sp. Group II 'C75']